jgi:hypothetical protein
MRSWGTSWLTSWLDSWGTSAPPDILGTASAYDLSYPVAIIATNQQQYGYTNVYTVLRKNSIINTASNILIYKKVATAEVTDSNE